MTAIRRPDTERWKYARACLEQGMGYTAASLASGLHEPSLRGTFPGYGRKTTGKPPIAAAPEVFEECAALLPEASPRDCRKVAALALALLSESAGAEAALMAMVNIAAALPAVRVHKAYAPALEPTPARITAQQVIAHVGAVFGLSPVDMASERRTRGIARPRQIAMYAVHKLCPHMSFPAIARALGKKDHTTIMHGVKRITSLIETDRDLAEQVAAVIQHFDEAEVTSNLFFDALRFRRMCEQYGAVMGGQA